MERVWVVRYLREAGTESGAGDVRRVPGTRASIYETPARREKKGWLMCSVREKAGRRWAHTMRRMRSQRKKVADHIGRQQTGEEDDASERTSTETEHTVHRLQTRCADCGRNVGMRMVPTF